MYLCVYLLYCLFYGSMGGNGTELLLHNKDQDAQIAELKTLVAELKTLVENQNTKISDQNMRLLHIKDQDIKIAELKTLVEHQNTIVERQNTKFSEQNVKMCKLDSEIEKLRNFQSETTESETTAAVAASATNASNTDIPSGVVFTRWGRADCPEYISTSVYNGTTGGSYYKHTGGAVNYVCMPHDPIWDENKHYPGPQWGYLYGSEYQHLPNFAGKSLQDYEVPCSVCRATAFSTKLMIPGRNTCYPGWTKAYAGELTSGYHNNAAASEYACLDRQPQGIGRKTNLNGVLFFPVRAQCGSLPCQPYESNTLLTCVVCLK